MRPSEYFLNPEKLENLVGYVLTFVLTIAVFGLWTVMRSKNMILSKGKTS